MRASATDAAIAGEGPARPGFDAVIALAASLLFLAACFLNGLSVLEDGGGDNDSLMRLVQIRDLLAGQGWFDLMQYRMGPDGGFEMHWSRLVDLPVALLIVGLGGVTGDIALAETLALTLWPVLLFGLSLYLIVKCARALSGDSAVLPAAVIGALTLYFVNVFRPGAIDHHNVQLALALATILFLLKAQELRAAAALAGACAALMLAVAMEAAPYAAVAGAIAAAIFLVGRPGDARIAAGFGAAFALVGALSFAATVPVDRWLAAHCDALSMPQVSVALLGGGGLAIAASVPAFAETPARRAGTLVGLGLAVVLLVVLAFPQCLGDPYASVDERLRLYWLDSIVEVQSAAALFGHKERFAAFFVTPALGLAALAWHMRRHGVDRGRAILSGFLAAAYLVSLWQVRGTTFALPIAAIALAGLTAEVRRRAAVSGTARSQLAVVLAWLVSFNMAWQFAIGSITAAAGAEPRKHVAGETGQCYARADYARLAELPAGTVLSISNLGAAMLLNTPHRAIAGPYHRNLAGNGLTLDMLMGDPAAAGRLARLNGIDYVALCPGNSETQVLAQAAQGGLLAGLLAGDVPDWLQPVEGSRGETIRLYRVRGP